MVYKVLLTQEVISEALKVDLVEGEDMALYTIISTIIFSGFCSSEFLQMCFSRKGL
jgi:hypothetical protein